MKIVCDSCSTKYSIADEKVRGKVFKIRCKKCAHIIVVRGNTDPQTDSNTDPTARPNPFDQKDTKVFDYSGFDNAEQSTQTAAPALNVANDVGAGDSTGEAEQVDANSDAPWYLVIDGEQQGPMSAQDVYARVQSGQADQDTYGWREGFAEWLRIVEITEFSGYFSSIATEATAAIERAEAPDLFAREGADVDLGTSDPQPAEDTGQAPLFDESGDVSGGLFSADAVPTAVASPRAIAEKGGDLQQFANSQVGHTDPSLFASAEEEAPKATSSSPRVTNLKGQRNENSVLFSLNNLAQMAGGSKPATSSHAAQSHAISASPSQSGAPQSAPRMEGSGLLDIRAMAATMGGKPSHLSSRPDDLPLLGGVPLSMSTPSLAVPVVPRAATPRWLMPALISMGVLLIGVGSVLVYQLTRPAKTTTAPAPVVAVNDRSAPPNDPTTGQGAGHMAQPENSGNPEATATTGAVDPAASATTSTSGTSDPVAAATTAPAGTHDSTTSGKSTTAAKGRETTTGRDKSTASSERSTTPPAPVAEKAVEKPPQRDPETTGSKSSGSTSSSDQEIKCMIDPDSPACRKRGKSSGESESSGDLPEKLAKSDIQEGIGGIRGQALACHDKFNVPGTVSIKLTISPGGSVSSAMATGAFAGTPTGSCVESAVKKAKFKKFSGAAMGVTYPFVLR